MSEVETISEEARAKQLVDQFYMYTGIWVAGKLCAMYHVDQLLEFQKIVLEYCPADGYEPRYWKNVRAEIDKLKQV
jgi:hypothetical protein